MKIVIWRGCRVVAEHDHPDQPGPDLHIDPLNDLIGARKGAQSECPVPYSNGLTGTLQELLS